MVRSLRNTVSSLPQITIFGAAVVGSAVPPLPAIIVSIYAEGDSRTNQESLFSAGSRNSLESIGPFTYAQRVTGNKVRLVGNGGVGGEGTAQMLAQVQDTIAAPKAAGAQAIKFMGGVNDPGLRITVAQTKANVTAYAMAVRSAGLWLILSDETPRGSYSGALADALEIHRWLQQDAPSLTDGIIPWPTWDAMLDPATGASGTGTYQPKAGYTRNEGGDFLHFTSKGANAMGIALGNALLASGKLSSLDLSRPWQAGDAVLNGNPGLTGSGGQMQAGISGSLASGMIASRGTSGPTVVASLPSTGTQRFVFSGTAASAESAVFTFSNYDNASVSLGLVPGQVFDARANIKLAAGHSGIRQVALLAGVNGTIYQAYSGRTNASYVADDLAPDTIDAHVFTPPALVQSGAVDTFMRVEVKFVPSATVSGTLEISGFAAKLAA